MTKLIFLVTEDWYFVSHRLPIARAAVDAGMEVVVATRISDKKHVLQSAGLKVISVNMERSGTNPFKEAATVLRLYKLLRNEQPDIVHLIAMKPVVLGGLAAFMAGIKNRVMAVAGLGFLFAEDGRKNLLRRIVSKLLVFLSTHSRIIVQNPDDASILVDSGVQKNRICMIKGSGVDLEAFRVLPEPEGVPVVMLASRLLWDKGIGEFVHAARLLQEKGITARFVLVGAPDPDNPKSVTKADIEKWIKDGLIEWWGKSNKMPETLSLANIVCLPSYREGLPKVLLEAMACGRACVTTDAPGCREAVKHGENGLLVPVRDTEKLASALERLLLDPELRGRMGRRGRKCAEQHFSQEKVIEQTLAIYRDILQT